MHWQSHLLNDDIEQTVILYILIQFSGSHLVHIFENVSLLFKCPFAKDNLSVELKCLNYQVSYNSHGSYEYRPRLHPLHLHLCKNLLLTNIIKKMIILTLTSKLCACLVQFRYFLWMFANRVQLVCFPIKHCLDVLGLGTHLVHWKYYFGNGTVKAIQTWEGKITKGKKKAILFPAFCKILVTEQ